MLSCRDICGNPQGGGKPPDAPEYAGADNLVPTVEEVILEYDSWKFSYIDAGSREARGLTADVREGGEGIRILLSAF